MKNIFIQKKIGACVLFCLANHLNEEKILIDNDYENCNGLSTHEAGLLLERYSDKKATLKTIFLDYTGLVSPFVLEPNKIGIDEPNQDRYICGFLTVNSKTIEGGYHWLYFFKRNDSDTIYISDPYLEDLFLVSKFKLPELDIVEISLTVNPNGGGINCYSERFFPYALA